MRKLSWLFASLALLAFTACGKKDGGSNNNNYAYSPGQCNPYQNSWNGNQYSTGQYQWRNNICVNISTNQQVDPINCNNNNNSGNRYYWNNNQCIDRQTGNSVPTNYCQNQGGNTNWINNCNPNTNFPGQGNYWNQQNVCSQYNRAGVTYYPMHYPYTGQTVCIGYSNVMTIYSSQGYWPSLYSHGNYNMFRACDPNNSRCKCVSLGVGFLQFGGGICM